MIQVQTGERVLNPEQLAAVQFGTGPLLIIAGAGTGKTTVITERIKHLITTGQAKPAEILALTFTEKAAREMEERVDVAMPYGYTQMFISTFHSFCDRILKDEVVNIGLTPGYRLLSDADLTMMMRRHLFEFDLDYFRPLGNPTKFISGMLTHFSRLQDEDVTVNEYLGWVKKKQTTLGKKASGDERLEVKKYVELAQAFKLYETLKFKHGVLDFSDLITQALRLFRSRPNVLASYRKKFKFLLIDEFQDTNVAQNELIIMLAGEKQNITCVADDDQCLPGSAMVTTLKGEVPIKNIRKGDMVITAVGKGYLSTSEVLYVNKTTKKARFLTFKTESGKLLRITDNHKMFCMIPGKKYGSERMFYVYLMWRNDLGWRLGITDDLAQRLRLERSADKIVVLRSYLTLEEAKFHEVVWSLEYQIPTYPFKPRKQMKLTGEWLHKLFTYFDTNVNAHKLAHDLKISLDEHHYALAGVVRGSKERIKIILRMCARKYTTKWANGRLLISPKVLHTVEVQSSSETMKQKLIKGGISVLTANKGWKIRKYFHRLEDANVFAQKLKTITDGIFEVRFAVGKRNTYSRQAFLVSAKNILEGMYVPVLHNFEVEYERVTERREEITTEEVYDLEIAHTHNFVADAVVVHNSIYKFRGAAVSNVISFRKHFLTSKLIVLTKNYRSTQTILDTSHRIIQHNNPDRLEVKEGVDKKLVSMREIKGKKVKFIHADRVEHEAELVAKEIRRLKVESEGKENAWEWRDFAILIRANNHADPFVRAFVRFGIPFQFLGPGQLFRQAEIKELIAYLQILADLEDNVAWYKVLSIDFFGLNQRDIAAIAAFAKRQNLSLFEACEIVSGVRVEEQLKQPFIQNETRVKLKQLVSIVHRHLDRLPKDTAGQILFYFLEDTGILKHVLEYSYPLDERKAANITAFFNKLKTFEIEHETATVSAVLDWILLSMELGDSPLGTDTDWVANDAVSILTVHSAKGLEFPVVFLVNLVSQRFPTTERREQVPIPEELIKEELPEGDYHEEEERRLFYVGMTRARDLLYFTAADFYGEGKREKKLSPFIFEALGEETQAAEKGVENRQLSLLDWKTEEPKPTPQKTSSTTVNFLSYSQIETFLNCPLHYKLRYLLNIPSAITPALSFGSSVHAALKEFYQSVISGERVNKDKLLGLLDKHWQKEGYGSKKYEKEMLNRGQNYLSGFFDHEFDLQIKPLLLEQPFIVPIKLAGKLLKIGGRIDRIDDLGDRGINITDYKTGKIPSKREVDANLQLTMYAIAATEIPEPPFNRTPDKVELTFYYFDLQQKITTTRTREQLEEAKAKIFALASQIESSNFRCSGSTLCTTCEYKLFCGHGE
ncbi:UvrD-helicase domain-containing protein [Candidatus Gottesmanbacteria bacterium]|nr:UvrD-helicase domain-containing protein [Candidatus Gottesmanbacteria bacterium]